MYPLRIILIFMSATLSGFFVLRNLKSQPNVSGTDATADESSLSASISEFSTNYVDRSYSKVHDAFVNRFWTCIDMASGCYLWRNLVSSSSSSFSSSKKSDCSSGVSI